MTYPRTISGPRGFTLIEVMISIAIVLAMIIGVNQVFKVAADTVGAGQAISATIRDSRAMQSVLQQDLSHAVLGDDAPFLIIDSRSQFAFRNAADQQGDIDGNAWTTDFDDNNVEGETTIAGELISPAITNGRSHRVDTFSFFARDLFRRQTGNLGTYVADMSSNEAWVTYGHGRVFDQSGAANLGVANKYFGPGLGTLATNPKNFFSNDWVLLRNAMLLVAPTVTAGALPGTIDDKAGNNQQFWARMTGWNLYDLPPLGRATPASNSASVLISDARYDLVGTTIDEARQMMSDYITQVIAGTANYYEDWFTLLPSSGTQRFRVNPYPIKPIDSTQAAYAAPILLSHCSQFIVEYAGDFLTQDATGLITAAAADGQIDYFVDGTIRHVRWYGFPRDVTGPGGAKDGVIRGWQSSGVTPNDLIDVVPLRDLIRFVIPTSIGASFEKIEYKDSTGTTVMTMPPRANYANPTQDTATGVDGTKGMNYLNRYVCAWSPNDTIKPKMIRVVITLDDPTGRLADGQTFEYVINLP